MMYPYETYPTRNPLGGILDAAALLVAPAAGIAYLATRRARQQAPTPVPPATQPATPSPAPTAVSSRTTVANACQAQFGHPCSTMDQCAYCNTRVSGSNRVMQAACAYVRADCAEDRATLAQLAVEDYNRRTLQDLQAVQAAEQETVDINRSVPMIDVKKPGQFNTGVIVTTTPVQGLGLDVSTTSVLPVVLGVGLGVGAWLLYSRRERQREIEELHELGWRS